jgi:hypothetical protein
MPTVQPAPLLPLPSPCHSPPRAAPLTSTSSLCPSHPRQVEICGKLTWTRTDCYHGITSVKDINANTVAQRQRQAALKVWQTCNVDKKGLDEVRHTHRTPRSFTCVGGGWCQGIVCVKWLPAGSSTLGKLLHIRPAPHAPSQVSRSHHGACSLPKHARAHQTARWICFTAAPTATLD